jgi:hypothetical protein
METYKLPNNRVLTVEQEEYPDSPRNWDNLGTMICFHRRYDLGDKHDYKASDFSSWEELEERIKKDHKVIAILPLYLYDHSGITISTSPFSCRWDSGQIGFIFIDREKKNKLMGKKRLSKEEAIKALETEVKIYDQYLTGAVYRFTIAKLETCNLGHEHKIIEESCGGFYGDDIKENGILDHLSKEDREAVLQAIEAEKPWWLKRSVAV